MNDYDLKRLQNVELEMLLWAASICEEHGLTYFIVGGTLLGAIRHKGFIPWDDDLDIAMPRDDYNKFIEIAKGSDPEKYIIQSSNISNKYWLPFSKVRKLNTIFDEPSVLNYTGDKGIFIDVFPLDYAPKEKSLFQKIQATVVKKLYRIIIWKNLHYIEDNKQISISNRILSCFPASMLIGVRDSFMKMFNRGSKNYIINLGSNYNYTKQTMPIDMLLPIKKVEFCGVEVSAPNNPEYYLNRLYGDYMKLPPAEKRINHNPATVVFDCEESEQYGDKRKN